MKNLELIKSFLKTNKDGSIICHLAHEMFEEGKEDPALILTHVIIYQYHLLETQQKILNLTEEAAA